MSARGAGQKVRKGWKWLLPRRKWRPGSQSVAPGRSFPLLLTETLNGLTSMHSAFRKKKARSSQVVCPHRDRSIRFSSSFISQAPFYLHRFLTTSDVEPARPLVSTSPSDNYIVPIPQSVTHHIRSHWTSSTTCPPVWLGSTHGIHSLLGCLLRVDRLLSRSPAGTEPPSHHPEGGSPAHQRALQTLQRLTDSTLSGLPSFSVPQAGIRPAWVSIPAASVGAPRPRLGAVPVTRFWTLLVLPASSK